MSDVKGFTNTASAGCAGAVNTVPEGWSLQPLSALANYYNGRAFKPEDWSSEGLPIIRIAQINNRNAELDYYAGNDVSDKNRIRDGDLLFSWSATLTALIWDRGDAVLNQHIFKVEEKGDVDRSFLHQLILNSIEPLAEHSHGSTMKHIKKSVLDDYCVETPPLPEQQKIAAILSSVDEVIEKTRAQIDKLKDLKTGMMQELLTKGIGHTEFKDSPVGRIPASWDVVRLSDVTQKISDRDHTTPKYVESSIGVPIVSPTNLDENMELDLEKLKYITMEAHEKNRKKTDLKPNDLIFSRIGAGLGKSYLVGKDFWDFSILHSLCQIRVSDDIRASYLDWYLKSDFLQKRLWIGVQSIGVPDLGLSEIGHLPVILPRDLDEQDRIVSVLNSIKIRVNSSIKKKKQLTSIKKALMQDLLTGKVRVNVEDKEAAVG